MKALPILFSAPMVRSLLAGTKTQTRRIVKPQPEVRSDGCWSWSPHQAQGLYYGQGGSLRDLAASLPLHCPYGRPGDLLYVREGGELLREAYDHDPWLSKDVWRDAGWRYADGSVTQCREYDPPLSEWADECSASRRPSIHMPRWASRLTLEITDVRVERLQDISEADAIAEGVREPSLGRGLYVMDRGDPGTIPREVAPPLILWQSLWRSINGDASWEANEWVWAISFRVHRQNVDALLRSRQTQEERA